MKQKSEKKFKIFKSETGKIIYDWAYQCPKCKKIRKVDLENWVFEGSGGLGVECKCKFGQVITGKDMEKAIHLTRWQYDNLAFEKEKEEKQKEWKKINGRWILE